ncbi:MAG: TatD family hydrolase [Mycoplasmataceae bacterium]|nr:TatD family hydrolase [Mycoplasmataceae bacterium]
MKYIDTHGHLNSIEFQDDVNKYIEAASLVGVHKIIIPGTSHKDSLLAIDIAKDRENIYPMVALHPTDGFALKDIEWLKDIDGTQLVGVGETGIDLYRKENPPVEMQKEIFRIHIRFAMKYDLPVIIHTRDAEQETYDVITEEEFKGIKFIIHCSTINKDWALKFVELGGYISFSGIVTFKNAKEIQEAAMSVPLERILTETDSPYLAPVPKRGRTNMPEYVRFTTDYVASIRSEDDEVVKKEIYKNAHAIFNI